MDENITKPNFMKVEIPEGPVLSSGQSGEIEVITNTDEHLWYRLRTTCDCGSNEHVLNIDIEWEKDLGVSMVFYYKTMWTMWKVGDEWLKRLWLRISTAAKVLFTGEIQLEEGFMFRGEKQISALISTLTNVNNRMKRKALNIKYTDSPVEQFKKMREIE
jgi:hypothetical protein